RAPYPGGAEGDGPDLAGPRSDQRGAFETAGDPPDDRPEHPAAVQWEAGNQVEAGQPGVDPRQVRDDRAKGAASGERIHDRKQAAEREAGEWSRPRNGELGAWRGRVLRNLCNTAEHEQHDAARADPVAAGRDGVSELMPDHRREKRDRGAEPHGP